MKINTNSEGPDIYQNDSQQNPASFFNVYKVSLTREQQKALSMLLPSKYSFQPFKITRSLDQESLKSQPKHIKKKHTASTAKQAKDPDFSISHMSIPSVVKEQKSVKIESSQAIPGGQPFMQCYMILKKLKKSFYAYPFKQPVDPKALGIPEYLNIVLQPIDLKTIEQILKRQGYKHPSEFHRDIYKMMMNSYKFNQRNSQVFQATKEFQEEYLKIVKEAKDGKLVCPQKKIKMQDSSFPEVSNLRDKTSQQLPSQPIKAFQKQFSKKQKHEKPWQNKSLEKVAKQKEKDKEQKQKQKQQIGKVRIEDHQKESYRNNFDPFISNQPTYIKQSQEPKCEVKSQFQPEDFLQLKQHKAESKLQKQDYQPSVSNQPSIKPKVKSVKESKIKQKKLKKVFQQNESPNEFKELKETTQAQNEKSFVFNQVKNKLTDLLKKLNDYQLPNKIKNKTMNKPGEGYEHPNLNNFTTISAAQKKKLAEKISMLPFSELKYIVEICFRNKKSKARDQEGVYQIDLQKLDPKILKQLSNFVGMRVKKTKKESYKSMKEEIKMHNQQQAVEEAQNEQQEVEDQGQEQQISVNQQNESHLQRSYSNLLGNEDPDFNDHYRDRNNYALDLELIDSQINEHRNDYSQEFHF